MFEIFNGKTHSKWDKKPTMDVDINGVPKNDTPHQMLVTDAEGKSKWVDRTHYAHQEVLTVNSENLIEFEGEKAYFVTDSITNLSQLANAEAELVWSHEGNTIHAAWTKINCDAAIEDDVNTLIRVESKTETEAYYSAGLMIQHDSVTLPNGSVLKVGLYALPNVVEDDGSIVNIRAVRINTVKKLDAKYLPNIGGAIVFTSDLTTGAWVHTCNVPFEELSDALRSGTPVVHVKINSMGIPCQERNVIVSSTNPREYYVNIVDTSQGINEFSLTYSADGLKENALPS